MSSAKIHPDTRVGHIHLKVTDLDRAVAFYGDVLGFGATGRRPRFCRRAATTTISA